MTAAALIVIDLQVGMMDGVRFPPLYDYQGLLERVAKLIGWARTGDVPVIFIQHEAKAGEALERGTPGWAIHPAIAPAVGEAVFSKTVGDAFAQTGLAA